MRVRDETPLAPPIYTTEALAERIRSALTDEVLEELQDKALAQWTVKRANHVWREGIVAAVMKEGAG